MSDGSSSADTIGSTPQFDAPTLATLYGQIIERPRWAAEDPLVVDAETFEKALTEMTEAQKRRGFPVARAVMTKRNFLLRGVPVVTMDG